MSGGLVPVASPCRFSIDLPWPRRAPSPACAAPGSSSPPPFAPVRGPLPRTAAPGSRRRSAPRDPLATACGHRLGRVVARQVRCGVMPEKLSPPPPGPPTPPYCSSTPRSPGSAAPAAPALCPAPSLRPSPSGRALPRPLPAGPVAPDAAQSPKTRTPGTPPPASAAALWLPPVRRGCRYGWQAAPNPVFRHPRRRLPPSRRVTKPEKHRSINTR